MGTVKLKKPTSDVLRGGFGKIKQDGFVKMYYTAVYALVGLPDYGRDLMDYCLMMMDEDNVVVVNKLFKERFKGFVVYGRVDEVQASHSDSSIKRGIYALKERRLLIETGYRGVYVVNPEFFFRKDEEHRVKAIKLMMKFDEVDSSIIIETDEKEGD
jgi:hypothetical protein